jgi:predicted Fe-Mo cluster-binding NifX family protein
MILALPLTDEEAFSAHFGEAKKAGFYEVEPSSGTILRSCVAAPPESAPCSWAEWLASMGVEVLLVSSMGQGAWRRMEAAGVRVHRGVVPAEPADLLRRWMEGDLPSGPSECRHDEPGHGHACGGAGGGHEGGHCGCSH